MCPVSQDCWRETRAGVAEAEPEATAAWDQEQREAYGAGQDLTELASEKMRTGEPDPYVAAFFDNMTRGQQEREADDQAGLT